MLNSIVRVLNTLPHSVYLYSFSSLDSYFRVEDVHLLYVAVESGLIELARTFPDLQFPGTEEADGFIILDGVSVNFKCYDSLQPLINNPFSVLGFLFDTKKNKYLDLRSAYQNLKQSDLALSLSPEYELRSWRLLADAAILVSRYHFDPPSFSLKPAGNAESFSAQDQRDLLTAVLTGRHPEKGLNLLLRDGFIEQYWPEIYSLDSISHNKEYHPEGNVWEHTLETFNYRKTADPVLSFGLLLHDIGKPQAEKNEGKQFDKHAQIGSRIAERFLRRLGFRESFIQDVSYLVHDHMIPAAVSKLPAYRTEKIMASPLFPLLLEVYRCDESSTFRGPDNYYKACEKYRMFLKHNRNPYRTPDGKKVSRSYMERAAT